MNMHVGLTSSVRIGWAPYSAMFFILLLSCCSVFSFRLIYYLSASVFIIRLAAEGCASSYI